MNLYNKLSFAFKMLTFHSNVLRGSIFVEQLERCNLVLYMQCNHINIEHCFFYYFHVYLMLPLQAEALTVIEELVSG